MVPGNWAQSRNTFTNLTQAGSPYYYPSSAGISGDGFDDLDVRIYLVSGAGNTLTATVWSDTGAGLWLWDETRGGFDFVSGAYGVVSVVAGPGNTATARLLFRNHGSKLWRLRLEVLDGGAADNSGIVEFWRMKG